jgi:hypothetical protein
MTLSYPGSTGTVPKVSKLHLLVVEVVSRAHWLRTPRRKPVPVRLPTNHLEAGPGRFGQKPASTPRKPKHKELQTGELETVGPYVEKSTASSTWLSKAWPGYN